MATKTQQEARERSTQMKIRKLFSILLGTAAISLGGGSMYAAVPDFGDGSLKLWLDATAITGLTNGQAVSTWTDSSGNGNNAVQVSPSQNPIYLSSAFNGKPVVRFDGVNDYLDAGNGFPITGNGLTIFTVLRINADNGSEGILGNRGGGAGYLLSECGEPDCGDRFTFVGGTTAVSSPPGVLGSVPGQKLVLSALKDGGTLTIYTNAVQIAMSGGDGALTDLGTTVLIGYDYQSSATLNGDLGAVLIYNRALTASERQSVNEFFFAEFSIPEPSVMAMMGVGALLLLRARRM
jgi:hypothetical protein